jgi:hypothetical protein
MPILTPNTSLNGAWIEVFKAGTHTDSAGNTATWTPERIDSYLAKYNPAYHEAPVRIDHVDPARRNNGGPAFGWIEALKREGISVLAKLKDVPSLFEEWVRQGFIKKRSIAFDERFGIHHLAFLGYNCPAIKGMENVYSSTGAGAITYEFSEESLQAEGRGTMIVNFFEATEILGRKVTEIIAREQAAGRTISYADAVMKSTIETGYAEVAGSHGTRYSFSQGGSTTVNSFAQTDTNRQDLLIEATKLVDDYNTIAGNLAVKVRRLVELRQELQDNTGIGKLIVSGDGWQGNALEAIPMLRMTDKEFPQLITGIFFNKRSSQTHMHFDVTREQFRDSDDDVEAQIELIGKNANEFIESEKLGGRAVSYCDAVVVVSKRMGLI